MIVEGFNLGASFLSVSSRTEVVSCARDIVEKNKQLRLKAATNKDFKRLDTIPSLKFAAKIRAEGQNMKIRLKKRGDCPSGLGFRGWAVTTPFARQAAVC